MRTRSEEEIPMFARGFTIAVLLEGLIVCAAGAVVAPNGAPFVLGVLACGGGLWWLLEPRS
jgi:hypothetical protein